MTAAQRILVVEDDHEIRFLLTAVLSQEGRELIAVETGAEALRVLGEGGIDLVILDLILPDVDGRSLLSQLRGSPDTAVLQVVVVTARAGPEIRQDCYALGADAFVEKPFDPAEIAADVAVRLERVARAERAALTDPLTGLLNKAGLKERCEAGASAGYALGLVEIDSFGVRSESWGWDETEGVVAVAARSLALGMPEGVDLARLGGGEFVLFVAASDLPTISAIAAEALGIVKGIELGPRHGQEPLTATIGVMATEEEMPLEEALEVARRRIFQAREREGDHVAAESTEPTDRQARVIVAEDDEISATILLHRLLKEGLDVTRFDNGQEAYDAAAASPPDLVILDVKMPGLDGFEVLERLRADTRFARTPVIMLTSMGQEADVVRGFRLGADDYVLKPFSPPELSARVRRLLTRGRSPSAV